MRKLLPFLLCTLAFAAPPGPPIVIGNGGSLLIPQKVASLANFTYLGAGVTVAVSDGTGATDCTTGGGSTAVVCQYSGSSWAAVAGSGSMVYPSGSGFAIVSSGTSWGTTLADPLVVGHGGTGTASTLTGIVRGGSPLTASELSGDATTSGSNAVTVVKINGTSLAGLATGIIKNTTATGVPSIAAAADVYGLFTSCTGSSGLFLKDGGTCAAPSGGSTGSITGSGLSTGSVYYLNGATLTLAEANTSSTLPGICVASSSTVCVYSGSITTGTWTAGGLLYVSDSSAGALTQTAPSTSGHFVQVVGIATSTTAILVMPSLNVAGIQ